MTNRKKRLKKGIESMEKQIELHKEKLKDAEEKGEFELAEYYAHEINNLRKNKTQKEELLEKEKKKKKKLIS